MLIAGRISIFVRYVNNIYCGASAGETVAKTVGSLWCNDKVHIGARSACLHPKERRRTHLKSGCSEQGER